MFYKRQSTVLSWESQGLNSGKLHLMLEGKLLVLQSPGLGEGLEAAVVGFLDVVRETAGRQLFR